MGAAAPVCQGCSPCTPRCRHASLCRRRPEETIMSAAFDLTSRFAKGLPDPSPRFGGFPKYNFIGGHNDPERIPIEGLIEATASVLRREGSKLAMYSLAQGPQGFVGLREMVADKL